MKTVLDKLKASYPELKFSPGKQFSWSPESGEIFYKDDGRSQHAAWALLHETGHALLEHKNYKADFNLLKLEVEAWEQAILVAKEIDETIDEDHIQDCLDTYRDWLYKRSICPRCSTKCLQQDDYLHYRCFNCHMVWKVSSSRFRRSYRSTKSVAYNSQKQAIVFNLER